MTLYTVFFLLEQIRFEMMPSFKAGVTRCLWKKRGISLHSGAGGVSRRQNNPLFHRERALAAGALAISLALTGACASRKDISQLDERMLFLEREVLAARTDVAANTEDLHNLDLRLEYLEREAAKRGVFIAPRPPRPASAKNTPPQAMQTGTKPAIKADGPAAPATAPTTTAKPVMPAPPLPKPAPRTKTAPATLPGADNGPTPVAAPPPSPGTVEITPSITTPALPSTPPPVPPRVSESTPSTPTPPSAAMVAPAKPEQKAYDAALQLYRTGRLPESEAAFQAFLQVYPNSRLVPNALYWKGETFYSRGRYTDAIFAFKDVQTRFPKHHKTPDSLLKTAMAYQKLDDQANASLHLTVLFEDWPKAEATQRARHMGLKP